MYCAMISDRENSLIPHKVEGKDEFWDRTCSELMILLVHVRSHYKAPNQSSADHISRKGVSSISYRPVIPRDQRIHSEISQDEL